MPFKLYELHTNYDVFILNRTGAETGTRTWTRPMGVNRSGSLSWFKCNVKVSTQFHTTHLFPVPVSVSVLAGMSTPLEGSNVPWEYFMKYLTFKSVWHKSLPRTWVGHCQTRWRLRKRVLCSSGKECHRLLREPQRRNQTERPAVTSYTPIWCPMYCQWRKHYQRYLQEREEITVLDLNSSTPCI